MSQKELQRERAYEAFREKSRSNESRLPINLTKNPQKTIQVSDPKRQNLIGPSPKKPSKPTSAMSKEAEELKLALAKQVALTQEYK
jgi:hypothetical protein